MSDEKKVYTISGHICSACRKIVNTQIKIGLDIQSYISCNHCGHHIGTVELKEYRI